jgi:hypothetical protein
MHPGVASCCHGGATLEEVLLWDKLNKGKHSDIMFHIVVEFTFVPAT